MNEKAALLAIGSLGFLFGGLFAATTKSGKKINDKTITGLLKFNDKICDPSKDTNNKKDA